MAFRGARREPAEQSGRPHRRLSVVALAAVLVALSVVVVTGRATGSGPTRCETFAADSAARAGAVSGAGEDLLVIGDSWTAGLGLDEPTRSWTVRLPGRVHTAGFSGSGFSAGASGCGPQGLNDWDMSAAEITAGFERLLGQLDGHPLTVVGPAAAPARSAYVPRVEGVLERLCAEHGVRFVAVSDLSLDYLPDLLHLTPAGHAAFGDAVAVRLSTDA
jgi:acyl-CoA thioesterase-1